MRSVHVLRKLLSQATVVEQVLSAGTGGINIDGTRLSTTPLERAEMLKMSQGFAGRKWGRPELVNYGYDKSMPVKTVSTPSLGGRWPANLVLSNHADVIDSLPSGKSGLMTGMQVGFGKHGIYGSSGPTPATSYADEGSVSRFFKVV